MLKSQVLTKEKKDKLANVLVIATCFRVILKPNFTVSR